MEKASSRGRYSIKVVTSAESMIRLLDRYIASGAIQGPLVPQLSNSLRQAKHHLDKGSADQAAAHMEVFLGHLHNEPMQPHATAEANAALTADAQAMLAQWKAAK